MARLSAVLAVAIPHLILCRRSMVNPLVMEQAKCQFPCGSKAVKLPYDNGEEVTFQLGASRDNKNIQLAPVSYMPRNDQCLKQCVVVGPGMKHNTGEGQATSWLHKQFTGQEKLVSCEQVVLDGKKVATALTNNGTRVKLCCANQECPKDAPLAPQPGPGTCFFPCGTRSGAIDYTRHDKKVKYSINVTIGKGDDVEYKPRDDYCLSECKWIASKLDDRLLGAERACHLSTGTLSVLVSRASYGKGHEGRLCCVPMKPKECPVKYSYKLGDTVWADTQVHVDGKLIADVGDEGTYLGPGKKREDGRMTLMVKFHNPRDSGHPIVDVLGKSLSATNPIKTIEELPEEPSNNAPIIHEPTLVSGEV